MNQESLLKTIYFQSSLNRNAPLKAVLETIFEGSCLEECHVVKALSKDSLSVAFATQHAVLDKWRELLTLILALKSSDSLEVYKQQALKAMRDLQCVTIWRDHQLFAVYSAVVAFLLNQAAEEPLCIQNLNGSCPLEADGYNIWAEGPHPLFHAELGVLWSLYGDLTGNYKYTQAAVKIAEWQRDTLDHNYMAFIGLLSREGEASERLLLINNFLLFNVVARAADRSDMAFLAEKQLEQISKISVDEPFDVPVYAIIIEEYFNKKSFPIIPAECFLPSTLVDESLALICSRSSEGSAIATLYGGRSGLGCYHHQDVKVVSFGPQHMPLGDCSGFGVEGHARLLGKYPKTLSSSSDEFILEGTVRMSPYISANDSECGVGGGWVDCRQHYKNGVLSVETKFQNIFDPKDLLFSFFVKCKNCVVDGDRTVKPRSLNRYNGKTAAIKLQGADSSLTLKAGQDHEEMHVIPLGGGDNFWGADFLVAYLLKGEKDFYSWHLHP